MVEGFKNYKKYCFPSPNEFEFIADNQSLSLVLGSCISTVFLGRSEEKGFILAANHIVIANPRPDSIAAKKSAHELIHDILDQYKNYYNINKDDIICLYLIGAGKRVSEDSFRIHEHNIEESTMILNSLGYDIFFDDTMSHVSSVFSISEDFMSVFIDNIVEKIHISFIVDLKALFNLSPEESKILPAKALQPLDAGFEYLIKNKIITSITGSRFRHPG
ncbi:hypothetical protein ACFL20_04385 [Spirochaetota bacterium]